MAEPFISKKHSGIIAQAVSPVTSSTYGDHQKKPKKDFKSLFKQFLEERKETLPSMLEKNNEIRNELKALKEQRLSTETVCRLLPDGTIMITRYENGRIVRRLFKKPHVKDVPDTTKPIPRAPDGMLLTTKQKMKRVVVRPLFEGTFE